MVELEKMNNLGYVVAIRGKDMFVVNDCLPLNKQECWGSDLADVIVYPTIEEARDIKRNFDSHKNEFHPLKDVDVEVRLMHKKQIMMARLKG